MTLGLIIIVEKIISNGANCHYNYKIASRKSSLIQSPSCWRPERNSPESESRQDCWAKYFYLLWLIVRYASPWATKHERRDKRSTCVRETHGKSLKTRMLALTLKLIGSLSATPRLLSARCGWRSCGSRNELVGAAAGLKSTHAKNISRLPREMKNIMVAGERGILYACSTLYFFHFAVLKYSSEFSSSGVELRVESSLAYEKCITFDWMIAITL